VFRNPFFVGISFGLVDCLSVSEIPEYTSFQEGMHCYEFHQWIIHPTKYPGTSTLSHCTGL
jgi:hypothetical protein